MFQAQIIELEARLSDEQNRRQKSEERCRAFKDILDKLKLSNTEKESRTSNLHKLLEDNQHKLTQYRHECKDLGKSILTSQSI